LYHRSSSAGGPDDVAAQRALGHHLAETGRPGTVSPGPAPGYHRVRFAVRGQPLVSILIPSACHPVRIADRETFYLTHCAASLRRSCDYGAYEILLIHNRPVPAWLAADLGRLEVRAVPYDGPFNWSVAMNRGAAAARETTCCS